MPLVDSLVFGLRIAGTAVGTAAIFRLYYTELRKRFRVLFGFLSFSVLRALALFLSAWFPGRPRNNYAWTWVTTEPILWVFYILLGLDLFSLVLQDYKGLRTVGRWIFLIALPVSIVISAFTVLPYWSNPRGNLILFYYTTIDRGIMFSLVVFILVTLFLLSWYPISLSRNMVIHAGVCTVFLISASMGYFVRNIEGDSVNHAVDLAHQVITLLCWSAWLFFLTPRGETKNVVIRHQFTAEEEKRLVNQLTAINSSLLRATRK